MSRPAAILRLVKILGLLSSNVRGGDARITPSSLFPALMEEPLSKALDETIEIVAREVWPKANLPRVIDGWMNSIEPDLVMFSISTFWFLYESVPLRLERKFGPAGVVIGRASRKAAATPWLAHNRPFQAMRRKLQHNLGGGAYFEPDEVIKTSKAAIRAVLRREGAYLVVVGPSGGDNWATDSASARRIADRRGVVHDAMKAFCRSLHVEYWDIDQLSKMADPRPASLQGDQLHLDETGHRRIAEAYLKAAIELCQRAQAHGRPHGASAVETASLS